jgi:signal transduction histidine kinase
VPSGFAAHCFHRDTVYGLRSSTVPANEVARALSVLAEELAANQNDGNRADFRVDVEGTPRKLAPIVRDEVYRPGCEALRNAFRHGHDGRVELEIRFLETLSRSQQDTDASGIHLESPHLCLQLCANLSN